MNNYIPTFVDKEHLQILYTAEKIPVFQNKVYDNADDAKKALCKTLRIAHCPKTGFTFNSEFDSSLMIYDNHYQNEQAHSDVFIFHLENVKEIIKKNVRKDQKIIEIGCGKAKFLNMIRNDGYMISGFDPAYEGDDSTIVKEYFDEQCTGNNADFFILRHTLEHIACPYSFLKKIATANKYKGNIYIEVPNFDWIMKKKAFWDVFYEHCNYFTMTSLRNFFNQSSGFELFSGQYIGVIANLNSIKEISELPLKGNSTHYTAFNDDMKTKYNTWLKQKGTKIVWGASAKGSTFLNIFDKNRRFIEYVIDINPLKQNKFIGSTSHPVYAPSMLRKKKPNHILVMNENYLDEIKRTVNDSSINIEAI